MAFYRAQLAGLVSSPPLPVKDSVVDYLRSGSPQCRLHLALVETPVAVPRSLVEVIGPALAEPLSERPVVLRVSAHPGPTEARVASDTVVAQSMTAVVAPHSPAPRSGT